MKARHAPWQLLSALLFGLCFLTGCSALQGAPNPAPDPASASLVTSSVSTVDFGTVVLGTSQTAAATFNNSSNRNLTLQQATVSGSGFSLVSPQLPLILPAHKSVVFTLRFTPRAAGKAAGTLVVLRNASHRPTSLALAGTAVTPGQLSISPASLSFGSVQAGAARSQSEVLTNPGATSVTVSQAGVSGNGFSLSGLDLPLVLAPGKSQTFSVTFAPASAGPATGSISLRSNAATSSPNIALSGTGTAPGQLAVTPASLSFGNVTVGNTQSQSATLTATGAAVTVTSASAGPPEFSFSGLSLPLTLAAGQSVALTITFTPQSSGAASASAAFTSNAQSPTVTASLSGNGMPAPPTHSVALAWSPSTSASGYFVYRGESAGGPYSKLNPSPNLATSFTDTSVLAGQTYFYVTTATDQSGVESVYSNEVQAVVPAP